MRADLCHVGVGAVAESWAAIAGGLCYDRKKQMRERHKEAEKMKHFAKRGK